MMGMKVTLVVVIATAAVAGLWYYAGVGQIFGGWQNDGIMEVAGQLSEGGPYIAPSGIEIWLLVPNGVPCESTMTDMSGSFAFQLEIGGICSFNSAQAQTEIVEGLWQISVPLFGHTNLLVELADDLRPFVNVQGGA
jgi:hypothetical protein